MFVKIVFLPFRIGDLFSSKYYLPCGEKSFIVFKFACAWM